jgi:hypothetical protein
VNTTLVGLGKVRARLAHKDACRKLGHGVHIFGKVLDEIFLISSQLSSLEEFFLEMFDL